MAQASGKIRFSHDIERSYWEIFEELCAQIGGDKYRILEAAIDAFAALPTDFQDVLTTYRQGDRQLYLELLRGLRLPRRGRESGQAANDRES